MSTHNSINTPSLANKGDLLLGQGGGLNPAVLPASTNGFFLTLDNTQPTGAKWDLVSLATGVTDRTIPTWNGTSGASLRNNSTAAIDSAGRMQNSSQTSFAAYLSTTDTNVIGSGVAFFVGTGNPWTIIRQTGSGFATNGTFTAPVSGWYLHKAQIAIDGITTDYNVMNAILRVSGTSAQDWEYDYNNQPVTSWLNMPIVALVYMTAGDTCTLRAQASKTIGGGSNVISVIGGNNNTMWSCVLMLAA